MHPMARVYCGEEVRCGLPVDLIVSLDFHKRPALIDFNFKNKI